MRLQNTTGGSPAAVDYFLVRGAVADGVQEGILIAVSDDIRQ